MDNTHASFMYDTLRFYIHSHLEAFVNEVAMRLNMEVSTLNQLFKEGFEYFIQKNIKYNHHKCAAIVVLDEKERQCSRTKKYGCYCGLHHNKLQKLSHVKNLIDNSKHCETVFLKTQQHHYVNLQTLI